MDPATDPVWFYLESQYKWILSQLLNAFKAHEARVDCKDSHEGVLEKFSLPH